MGKKEVAEVTTSLGYCCVWSFLFAHRRVRTGELARQLLVDRTTIQYWRRKYKRQELTCALKPSCLKPALLDLKRKGAF
jgi:hypothetical protein